MAELVRRDPEPGPSDSAELGWVASTDTAFVRLVSEQGRRRPILLRIETRSGSMVELDLCSAERLREAIESTLGLARS